MGGETPEEARSPFPVSVADDCWTVRFMVTPLPGLPQWLLSPEMVCVADLS